MKNLLIIFLIVLSLLLLPKYIYAHPGNTAADGCHYCRTNCDKWGVEWNERHCHNGSTTKTKKPVATSKPLATIKPTVMPASTPSTYAADYALTNINDNTSNSDDDSSWIGWLATGALGVFGYKWLKNNKK